MSGSPASRSGPEAGAGGSTPAQTFREAVALLRTRRFGTFWFACLLSNVGGWAQQVAQPWLLLSIGASAGLVGLDAFAMDVPVLLLTLVGGVLADRRDRRRIIMLFQSVQMLCPLIVIALLLGGAIRPWMVILLSLVVGVTDALSMPSFQSIVPSIVAPERIAAGLALNSTQFNLSRIFGPALAGVLMAGFGAVACYAASAASYVPFILVALWVLPARAAAGDEETDAGSRLFSGVRQIVRVPRLAAALLTVFVAGALCGPLVTFSPVLVKAVFHGSAGQFSAAIAAFGVGGLLGACALLAVAPQRDRRRISWGCACLYALVVVLAAAVPWLWGLVLLLVAAGASMSVTNTAANTFLLSTADARLRGQTVSLYMLAMRGGASLGSLMTGVTVSLLGVREALALNGVAAIALQLLILHRYRTLPPALAKAGG